MPLVKGGRACFAWGVWSPEFSSGGRSGVHSAWSVPLCPQQPLGHDLLSQSLGLQEPVSVSRSLGTAHQMGGTGLFAGFESWLCHLPVM